MTLNNPRCKKVVFVTRRVQRLVGLVWAFGAKVSSKKWESLPDVRESLLPAGNSRINLVLALMRYSYQSLQNLWEWRLCSSLMWGLIKCLHGPILALQQTISRASRLGAVSNPTVILPRHYSWLAPIRPVRKSRNELFRCLLSIVGDRGYGQLRHIEVESSLLAVQIDMCNAVSITRYHRLQTIDPVPGWIYNWSHVLVAYRCSTLVSDLCTT